MKNDQTFELGIENPLRTNISSHAKFATLARKLVARYRRTGIWQATRYYFILLKTQIHHLVYDRWHDRKEHSSSGGCYAAGRGEIVGEIHDPVREQHYEPFPRLVTLWAIKALGIDPRSYSFIDYGSGRGRLVLTAARLPFRATFGVEHTRSLHDAAQENIAHYRGDMLKAGDIRVFHADATKYDLPDGNVIAFFFNPFQGETLDGAADRIEQAARASQRVIYVVYVNSDGIPLFADRPEFRRFRPGFWHRLRLTILGTQRAEFFKVEV